MNIYMFIPQIKEKEDKKERKSRKYLLQMSNLMFMSKGSEEKRIKHTSIAVFLPWSDAVGFEAR